MSGPLGAPPRLRRLLDSGRRAAAVSARFARAAAGVRWWPALGVLAAAVLAVCVNVLASRFHQRWDITSRGLYSLSEPTLQTLRALDEPVEVLVFIGKGDPILPSLRHLLTAYGAETRRLQVRFVDPDREPGELLALQQKYGIAAGRADDGRVVADAALVIARGEKKWFVLPEDLTRIDPEDGSERPRLEQALTEGIRNVLDRERPAVCFSAGHDELDFDDGGPAGLSELRYRLDKNNYEVRAVDLTSPRATALLAGCRVLVIAAPARPFQPSAARDVLGLIERGGNVLVLSGPVMDDEYRPVASGLDPIARAAGVELGADVVLEGSPELRLPSGIGERFFVLPKEHGVTAGLTRGPRPEQRAFVSIAQSLRPTAEGGPSSLLETSDQSFAVGDTRRFLDGARVQPTKRDRRGPLSVAMASELPKPEGSTSPHGARLIVIGSASVAHNQSFRDPALFGNRRLVENSIAWLAAQPALVSIPEKPSAEIGVALTEESLTELWRYVIVYLPATAGLLGALVLFRRRARERRSRRDAAKASAESRPAASAAPAPGQRKRPARQARAATSAGDAQSSQVSAGGEHE